MMIFIPLLLESHLPFIAWRNDHYEVVTPVLSAGGLYFVLCVDKFFSIRTADQNGVRVATSHKCTELDKQVRLRLSDAHSTQILDRRHQIRTL